MNPHELERTVDLLVDAARLKALPRTGWLMRGVMDAESVAAHSHGVATVALLLLDLIEAPLDRARVLAMAVLHDLPEAVLGDIPTPSVRHFPEGAKTRAEDALLGDMIEGTPVAENWRALWREFDAAETPEARLVRDADKLEMFLQAMLYERSGHRDVGDFWARIESYPWCFEESRALLEAVGRRRP